MSAAQAGPCVVHLPLLTKALCPGPLKAPLEGFNELLLTHEGAVGVGVMFLGAQEDGGHCGFHAEETRQPGGRSPCKSGEAEEGTVIWIWCFIVVDNVLD